MKALFFLIAITPLLSSCKKDPPICKDTENILTPPSVDISVLKNYPAIYDTLLKYPRLKVWGIQNDKDLVSFNSYIYYNGIIVNFGSYSLTLYKSNGTLVSSGSPGPDTIGSPTAPVISADAALGIARSKAPQTSGCAQYQSIIINKKPGSLLPEDYRLCWWVWLSNYTVIVDASTGEVYASNPL